MAEFDLRHVAEADDNAVGLLRQSGDAGPERTTKPIGEVGVVNEFDGQTGKRRFHAIPLVPGNDKHRPRLRAKNGFGGNSHQRPPANFGQQFVLTAHAARAAGREYQSGNIARRVHRLLARLRTGDDFHEEPANPHPGYVLAWHFKSGEKPHEHPIETVLLRAACTAGRAKDRMSGGRPD